MSLALEALHFMVGLISCQCYFYRVLNFSLKYISMHNVLALRAPTFMVLSRLKVVWSLIKLIFFWRHFASKSPCFSVFVIALKILSLPRSPLEVRLIIRFPLRLRLLDLGRLGATGARLLRSLCRHKRGKQQQQRQEQQCL